MNKQDLKELKGAKQIYIQSNDPRFNYSFHKEKDIVEFEKQPDIINISQYDYSFKRDDGGDTKLPDLISSSELASFQNLEDMEEFYRQKHPTLPDEYFGIMARYSTGNPITKKEVKNTLKKVKKNSNKSYPVGFKVVTGEFVLDFD